MAPAVSRSRRREASGLIEGLAACFAGPADPRATRRRDHRLIDILVIAVCAVVACAESREDIELYGRSKQAWLKTFLALPNGIPSHDTFRRAFMPIDPDAFEACFARWAQSLTGEVEREVVAIDGKTIRRSGSRRHDHGPLHLVNAWASDRGLVLGQREADGKSNAITAVPELLDTLHLDGSIVTLDAMGCQKDIAARIRAKGADYLLGLKANHDRAFGTGKAEAEIRYFFTSCGDDLAVLVRAIRRHRSIANALHQVLDVTFREDDSRVRDRTAAHNLALLRKIALNLVAGDRGSPTSLRGRRKKAAWNDDYMLQIIVSQAHA